MRDLRVPSSGQGVVDVDGSFSASPDGSTKICRRAFGRDGFVEDDDDDGALNTSSFKLGFLVGPERAVRGRPNDDGAGGASARTDLRVVDVDDETDASSVVGGSMMEDIIRFWKSRCLFSRRSRGNALRAIPRR